MPRIIDTQESDISLSIDLELVLLGSNYPIDPKRKTAVLMRQSGKGTDLTHKESRLRQEAMEIVATRLRGGDRSMVEVYDEGAGVSGQKRIDQRPEMNRLYNDIGKGIIGSIVVAKEDRLFRNKHLDQVSEFTKLAEKWHLVIIVPGGSVYDFTNNQDLHKFQVMMTKAAEYLEDQVKLMHKTREQKRARGEYVGGTLIAPYVLPNVARDRLLKEPLIQIVYGPWLEITLSLFRRLKDYNFNLSRLCRYIESQPYLFPDPVEDDLKKYLFRVALEKGSGGYTFKTSTTLKRWFTHPTLVGLLKAGIDHETGEETYKKAPWEAAVPFEIFNETYGALNGADFSGIPVQRMLWGKARHTKKNPDGTGFLVRELITVQGAYITKHSAPRGSSHIELLNYYRCYQLTGINEVDVIWEMSADQFDTACFNRLVDLAQVDENIIERVKAYFKAKEASLEDERRALVNSIAEWQRRVSHFTRLIDTSFDAKDNEIQDWRNKRLEATNMLEVLQRKLRESGLEQPEEGLPTFYKKLAALTPEQAVKMSFDEKKLLMTKLCRNIAVQQISPHLYSVNVDWITPVKDRPDSGLLWRSFSTVSDWTEEELSILRPIYETGDKGEIIRSIPGRTWQNITLTASSLGLHRSHQMRTSAAFTLWPRGLCFADVQALIDRGASLENAFNQAREFCTATERGSISLFWLRGAELSAFCVRPYAR